MLSAPWSSGPDRPVRARACSRVCAHARRRLVPGLTRPPSPLPASAAWYTSSNPGLQAELRGSSHGLGVLTAQCFVLLGEEDGRDQAKLETKVWEVHNPLVDKQIDQFLVVAR